MTSQTPSLTDSLLDIEGRVAVLRLNRDDVRNELTGTALIDDIEATVAWTNRNEEIGCLVITGAGKAFSSGGNIKHMANREGSFAGDVYQLQRGYRYGVQRIPLALRALEVPSIAAINGPAIGAGFDLTCMCDIRIAAADATMGETFINVGIVPGDGGGWLLQRLVGYQRAAELTFSGRVFGAEEAKQMGIVLEVVPGADLMRHVKAMASNFAGKPHRAMRLTKHLLTTAQRMELPDYLDYCGVLQGVAHHTDDHIEAVTAMLEKRVPKFTGQ